MDHSPIETTSEARAPIVTLCHRSISDDLGIIHAHSCASTASPQYRKLVVRQQSTGVMIDLRGITKIPALNMLHHQKALSLIAKDANVQLKEGRTRDLRTCLASVLTYSSSDGY